MCCVLWYVLSQRLFLSFLFSHPQSFQDRRLFLADPRRYRQYPCPPEGAFDSQRAAAPKTKTLAAPLSSQVLAYYRSLHNPE